MNRWIVTVALAAGGFGIGVSEFLIMGLLPHVAADLLPQLYAQSHERAIAASGTLSSAYAIGVVAGIVTTPLVVRRMDEKRALLFCSASMLVWTVLTALAPSLGLAVVLRFLAALTHATYIGVGAMAVAHVFGTANYGRGSAIVQGGLAGANLLGVPALTALGTVTSWRILLGSASVFFLLPLAALIICGSCIRPRSVTPATGPIVTSPQARSRMLTGTFLLLVVGSIFVFSGGFLIVTYVAPVTHWAQGTPALVTTAVAMLLFGIGMNLGNFGAGWLADRAAALAFWIGTATGVVGAIVLLTAPGPVGLGAGMLLIGVPLGGCSPAAQVLFMQLLPRYPRLAASLPSGLGNLGSFVGSLLGAVLLASRGPGVLAVGAIAVFVIGSVLFALHRRRLRGAGAQ